MLHSVAHRAFGVAFGAARRIVPFRENGPMLAPINRPEDPAMVIVQINYRRPDMPKAVRGRHATPTTAPSNSSRSPACNGRSGWTAPMNAAPAAGLPVRRPRRCRRLRQRPDRRAHEGQSRCPGARHHRIFDARQRMSEITRRAAALVASGGGVAMPAQPIPTIARLAEFEPVSFGPLSHYNKLIGDVRAADLHRRADLRARLPDGAALAPVCRIPVRAGGPARSLDRRPTGHAESPGVPAT